MSKLSPDCAICCETFTLHKRCPVECKKCSFRACRECIGKYVLSQEILTGLKCMDPDCDCIWDRGFLVDNLPKVFINKHHRKHRSNLLFHQELSRLPATMPFVAGRKKVVELKEEKAVLKDKKMRLITEVNKIHRQIWRIERDISHYKDGNIKESREFIRGCPAEGCRGFLSKAWKCQVCSIYVCSKCQEIKGKITTTKEDLFAAHTCDENNVKTANMLKKDSKPCPSCGVVIHKVSGCDQMWCTQCHVAFSWRTGRTINAIIHNPHYYEWQRQNGGAPRVAGDVRCGGYPYYYNFNRKISPLKKTPYFKMLTILHRGGAHFRHAELPRYQRNNDVKNRDLRISYILKDVDEPTFKSRLIANDIKQSKDRAIRHVLELLDNIVMERIIAVNNNPTIKEADKCYTECHKVREYCNDELKKISILYNQCVPIIDDNLNCSQQKFTRKKVK